MNTVKCNSFQNKHRFDERHLNKYTDVENAFVKIKTN